MRFLKYVEDQFEKVLAVDTEFLFDTTKQSQRSNMFCLY